MSKKGKTTTIKVNAAENEVVTCFRRLESEHTKLAFLVLLQGAAWGQLNQEADKKSLRSLVRP